ncbi:MAG TPA: TonB family protein [Verrucomicrobiae bacterium]|jgi:protein TonB
MEANRTSYELKSDLARFSMTAARREPGQKLAWVNSICLLFLIIGVVGARQGIISIKPVPPIHQIIPVVLVPTILPPQSTVQKTVPPQENNQPRVIITIPNAPDIRFSVPTIGTLVAPAVLASAPPLNPLETQSQIGSINNTGTGGERPYPPYPQSAIEHGIQGTVTLLLRGDAAGNVVSITIKESSGSPVLDQSTVAFIKNHWHLPVDTGARLFQTTIAYQLQLQPN